MDDVEGEAPAEPSRKLHQFADGSAGALPSTIMSSRRFSFDRTMRLNNPARFKELYNIGNSIARGPIKLYAAPNELSKPRLGISIGRRVGTAPRRNRIKRLLREAFRLMQHDWPRSYDLVVVVRPHAPLPLAEYQRAMSGAMVKLVQVATRK